MDVLPLKTEHSGRDSVSLCRLADAVRGAAHNVATINTGFHVTLCKNTEQDLIEAVKAGASKETWE